MVRPAICFSIFLLLLGIQPAAANPPVSFGTEDLPELPDTSGDVTASAPWSGPTDVIDLTAAWIEHDPVTDSVVFTIRTASAENLESTPAGHDVSCTFEGDATIGDEVVGALVITWTEYQNHSGTDHHARLIPSGARPNTVLQHLFNVELTTPGYFRFNIERADVIRVADEFRNPRAICSGVVPVPDTSVSSGSFGYSDAKDEASSDAVYSFRELRQAVSPAGEPLDPVEEFERTDAPAESTTSTTTVTDTPGFVFAFAVVAAALAIMVRRH